MDYIVVFVTGMIVATMLIRHLVRKTINRIIDQVTENSSELEENQLRVNLEFEQNTYYLYNNDNGTFVAQGNSLYDLKHNFTQRFPNSTITIIKGDPIAMENLKLQLKEFNEDSSRIRSTP